VYVPARREPCKNECSPTCDKRSAIVVSVERLGVGTGGRHEVAAGKDVGGHEGVLTRATTVITMVGFE